MDYLSSMKTTYSKVICCFPAKTNGKDYSKLNKNYKLLLFTSRTKPKMTLRKILPNAYCKYSKNALKKSKIYKQKYANSDKIYLK